MLEVNVNLGFQPLAAKANLNTIWIITCLLSDIVEGTVW